MARTAQLMEYERRYLWDDTRYCSLIGFGDVEGRFRWLEKLGIARRERIGREVVYVYIEAPTPTAKRKRRLIRKLRP